MTIYLVQDFAGGKYWTVRSFTNESEAEDFRARLDHKARIKIIKNK